MKSALLRTIILAASVSLVSVGATLAKETAPSRSFKAVTTGQMTLDTDGKKQSLIANTTTAYTWTSPSATERVLSLDSVSIDLAADGKSAMDISMSREKLVQVKEGNRTETTAETGPPALKQILTAVFGPTMYRVKLDAAGNEVQRAGLVPDEVKQVLGGDGIVTNVLVFHPQPPAGRAEWQSDTVLEAGNGGVFRGKLTYVKSAVKDGGQAYKVSGTLLCPDVNPAEGLGTKDGTAKITGEHVYDAARREWFAGTFVADISLSLTNKGEAAGSLKGTLDMKLEAQPAKK